MFEACKPSEVKLSAPNKFKKSRIIQQGTFFRLFFFEKIFTLVSFLHSYFCCVTIQYEENTTFPRKIFTNFSYSKRNNDKKTCNIFFWRGN